MDYTYIIAIVGLLILLAYVVCRYRRDMDAAIREIEYLRAASELANAKEKARQDSIREWVDTAEFRRQQVEGMEAERAAVPVEAIRAIYEAAPLEMAGHPTWKPIIFWLATQPRRTTRGNSAQ